MKGLLILLFLTMIISGSLCGYNYFGCSEFENTKRGYCQYLDAGEDNKVCNIINGKCISTYRDCEDYKEDVKKDICESIIPYFYIENKCVFSNNKCISKERTCSDFKFGLESNSNCELLKAEEENKKCVFINNKCEEHYKSCEYYDGNDEETCKSIILVVEDEPFILYKCSFEKGKCVKKERLCEEYIENPDGINYCHMLLSSDETKRCAYINNKCIEHYKDCKDYTGNDSKGCESIEPFDETNDEPYFNKKCVFEEGKCIRKEKTSCSEYKPGYYEDACSMIRLKDENKICVLLDDECIETYKACEDYKGDNEDICKSIIPTYEKDGFYDIDNELKCSLINNRCVSTESYCSENILTYSKYCHFKTKDKNKKCFEYKGKCIESYESCEDYNQNVDKETCENIIPESYYEVKCVYDSKNKKCISELLTCSSYKVDLIGEQCIYLAFTNNVKCEYSNGICFAAKEEDITEEENPNEGGKFEFCKMLLILYSLLIL